MNITLLECFCTLAVYIVVLAEMTEIKFPPIFELENRPRLIHGIDLYTSKYGTCL